jgi:pentatricopeptide repeat protein
MINTSGMQPNGMTWCALIDVCGRCNRSDLALKGLRMMMRQKANIQSKQINVRADQKYQVLANEVGAWTAAINACGKAGRIDTAIKLFHTMAKFGVKPNTITCGCLTDCLMKSKNENYLSETLTVLRYMKEENMVPSEVMYTSLIDRASILATIENERRGELILPDFGDGIARPLQNSTVSHDDVNESTTALDVYTELILSLTTSKSRGSDESNAPLVKVFLVFQEMKASGADPDLTCYNALLRACARAGAVIRQQDIMRRLQLDGLIPNDKTWKEMLRGGAQAGRSDLVEDIWKQALDYNVEGQGERYSHKKWMPDIDAFDALITSYLRHASTSNIDEKRALYERCITTYLDVIGKRSNDKKLHHIDSAMLQESTRSMLLVLMASVSLEEILFQSHDMSEERMFDQQKVRRIAKYITRLGCLQGRLPKSLIDLNPVDSFRKARSWTFTD